MDAPTQKGDSLVGSLRIQGRVIHALLMREILTRFGRHNIGFLWLFVEPMVFTLGVTALWTAMKATHGSNIPIVAFALTGYSSVLLWRNMPSRLSNALQPNAALMFHRNVHVIDIYAARLILEVAGTSMSFFILSLILIGVGWLSPPEDLLLVVCAWVLIAWFGAALGLFIGALSERSEMVDKLWHPMSYLLFPLSGAAFLVEALPPAFREVVLFLPMIHGLEMLREGYFGSYFKPIYDLNYLLLWCLGLSAVALAEVRTVTRRMRPE